MNNKTENSGELPHGLKLALDFLPLAAFFIAYKMAGMYWATGVLMALTLATLAIGYFKTGRLAKFPLYSAILVAIMGGLTLYLQNDTFIKMKPTVANLIFAGVLGGGLLAKRLFLKDLLGSSMELPEPAWRTLTLRWVIFFLVLAALNEYVWRTMSEELWVNYKAFGMTGLTFLFIFANVPFMMKNMVEKPTDPSANG